MQHPDQREEISIKGIAVSHGVGLGRPCFYHVLSESPAPADNGSHKAQKSLFKEVYSQVYEQLGTLIQSAEKQLNPHTVAIFRAHKMMLDELQIEILDCISHQELTARDAIERCFNDYADYFRSLDSNYMSERANDFEELKQLLMNLLTNVPVYLSCKEYTGCQLGECVLGNPHILVTDELTAHAAIRIRQDTRGIVTDKCGVNSHAAVICRSLEIPVVSGIKNPSRIIDHEDTLLLDGDNGTLIINPDDSSLNKYRKRYSRSRGHHEVVEPLEQFKVLANLDLGANVKHANEVKADGIGLYRTEFEMMAKDNLMTEQEQFDCYSYIIEQMEGKPVYFRLLDLGSDKSTPWLELEEEENPALGCRGARLLLARPELLQGQARALARASQQAQVDVIYPMITTLDQFLQLQQLFLEAVMDIENTQLRHGIMFEVPSACESAEKLYEAIDFGRVGCNDLMQYLYAYDRGRDDFDVVSMAKDPAIWILLRRLISVAEKAGKPLELCGALADTPEFIPRLIELGINTISTHCENIAAVRKAAKKSLQSHR